MATEYTREQLHECYLWIVTESIIYQRPIGSSEISTYLDRHRSTVHAVCVRLQKEGLVLHDDGDWIASDVHDEDSNEVLKLAEAKFDQVFPSTAPKRWKPDLRRDEPAYSEVQIQAGLKAHGEGKSWRETAEAAGLPASASYDFSKVVRSRV